jgi:hypothetical protein
MSDDLEPAEWIYCGRTMLNDGKAGHRWRTHTDEDVAYSKAPTGAVIGGRYQVQSTPDAHRAALKAARYLGQSDTDEEELAAWRLRDRAAAATADSNRAHRKAVTENGDFGAMQLRDVRTFLMTGTPAQRAGALAAVLRYLKA